METTDPAIPINIPAGSIALYCPIKYSKAPPRYEPATPNATVLTKPKFSSPGTIAFAILPTKIP